MQRLNNIAALLLIIFYSTNNCVGQSLKIGDTLPPLELSGVINSTNEKLDLSAFKGKLIILDFWGHGCPSCLAAFPKMDALQEKFGDQIQVIGVNRESKDSTEKLFKKFKKLHKPKFPLICGDTILSRLFPKNYLPWHAWIDGQNKVRFLTSGWNTTSENIAEVLKGQTPNLSEVEIIKDYDHNRSYLAQPAPRFTKVIQYSSFIAPSVPNLNVGNYNLLEINNGKSVQIFRYASSILDLVLMAYSEGDKYNFMPKNTVILNVPDTFSFAYPMDPNKWDAWTQKNAFTYELVLPASKSVSAYQFMQQDLLRYFNLKVKREKRWINCLSLTLLKGKTKVPNNPDTTWSSQINTYDRFLYKNNAPVDLLVKSLNGFLNSLSYKNMQSAVPLIVNRTGYKGNISIKIDEDILRKRDIPAIKETLHKYNLDLVGCKCLTTVLSVSQNP